MRLMLIRASLVNIFNTKQVFNGLPDVRVPKVLHPLLQKGFLAPKRPNLALMVIFGKIFSFLVLTCAGCISQDSYLLFKLQTDMGFWTVPKSFNFFFCLVTTRDSMHAFAPGKQCPAYITVSIYKYWSKELWTRFARPNADSSCQCHYKHSEGHRYWHLAKFRSSVTLIIFSSFFKLAISHCKTWNIVAHWVKTSWTSFTHKCSAVKRASPPQVMFPNSLASLPEWSENLTTPTHFQFFSPGGVPLLYEIQCFILKYNHSSPILMSTE